MLIMLILVVFASLYAVTSELEVASRNYARDDATTRAIALAKEALIGYAVTYRDSHNPSADIFGYLPCPDQSGNGVTAGTCGTAGYAAVGLLPYKTLGLPDLRDADGNCLWYAVSGSFKYSPPAAGMNWDSQGQFSIAGTSVIPDQGEGGAIAIIFAAGPPLSSQSRSASGSNPCQVDPSQVSGYLDGNYNFSTNTAIQITAATASSISANTNNDQLIWITPKEIFDKLVKRHDFSNALTASPPGQLNTLTDLIKAALELSIQSDLVAGSNTISLPAANTTGYTPFPPSRRIGILPTSHAALQSAGSLLDEYSNNYNNYYDNWNEQYRLAMCTSLTTPCLTVAGTSCRGALLFGGRTSNGQPRTSAQRTTVGTGSLGYYFESPTGSPAAPGGGLDILSDTPTTFSGNTAYSATSPSADVGTCLFPGNFNSFGQDIGSFSRIATSAGNPEAVINVAAHTITLGDPGAAVAGRGCVWYPTQLSFNFSLRAYYMLSISDLGEGFIFAVVDGPNNQAAITAGTICGATTQSLMGYSSAAVVAPKFGVEIDTRVQSTTDCTGSNRNDPTSNHMALVYWGTAASATDDNCHGSTAGTLGSSSQPLNPRTLTTSSGNVQTASWSGNVVTITTSSAHGLTSNQQVVIAGISPSQYNGNYQVAVIDATHLAYSLAANPGAYVSGGTVATVVGIQNVKSSDANLPYNGVMPLDTNIHVRLDVTKNYDATLIQAASWSANTVTVTAAAHGLLSNQRVTISSSNPAAYNGTYTITVADSTHFTYPLGADPGSYTAGGLFRAPTGVTVQTAASAASGGAGAYAVTITTASAHGFVSGQPVTIASVSPAAYNGTYQIVVVDATHFTYALGADPGAYVSGGTLTAAVALTLKAYVASNFPSCTSADFQNLAKDLSSFCPQTPTLEQDNVYMDDTASGKALATIFAGFANAHGTADASEQIVTISNFIIKTQ